MYAQQLHDNHMMDSICVACAYAHCLVQVAAYADQHLCVRKATDLDGRVHTHIASLESHHHRAQEVAAMLGMFDSVVMSCHADMPICTLMFCAFHAFSAWNAFSVTAGKQHVNVRRWDVVEWPGSCAAVHGTMCHAYAV